MSFVSAERARLAELLLRLGPDAPTLCEGWTTRDLAAHLYIREHRLDAAAGMFVPTLAGHLDSVTRAELKKPYDEVVGAWAAGPGRASLWRLLDPVANLIEHFVHLEDVRRLNGELDPREFSAATNDRLYRALQKEAPVFLRGSTKPVILNPTGRRPIVTADRHRVAERGDDVVRVSGDVGELILWVMGRDSVAQVTIDGDDPADLKFVRRMTL